MEQPNWRTTNCACGMVGARSQAAPLVARWSLKILSRLRMPSSFVISKDSRSQKIAFDSEHQSCPGQMMW
jgi:hypothetical protein